MILRKQQGRHDKLDGVLLQHDVEILDTDMVCWFDGQVSEEETIANSFSI
jgi:hypothetical protein